MNTPITRKRIRNHLAYCWWKYALVVVAAVVGWSLYYSTTRYRPPENKTIQLCLYTYGDPIGLDAYMQRVNAEDMPHMESMSCYLGSLDEQQGEMELTTYFLAGEGDVYLLSDEEFRRFAPGGVFRELEEEESLLTLLQGAEEDLQRGWMQYVNTTGESYGEEHLLGIPCSALPGMEKLVARPGEAWLCVLVNNGNDTNVMRFMEILVQDALEGPLVEINMEEEEK